MKRILTLAGAGALFLWTAVGLFAWMSFAGRVTVIPSEEQGQEEQQREARFVALADEVGALQQDLRALATAMGEGLQALNDGLLAGQEEHAADLQRGLTALREEVGNKTVSPSKEELAALLRELEMLRDVVTASAISSSAALSQPVIAQGEPAPETISSEEPSTAEPTTTEPIESAPSEPAPVAAAPAPPAAPPARKSFLAFKLPSDDFRFDERRTWAILPALSRVGFDAKTTLHDFTATTSTLEGELEADLSRPADSPRAHMRVQAASLVSGNAERDEAMKDHLAVGQHPELDFELARFEVEETDLTKMTATGKAIGRMNVRGVTREVSMPVRLSIDDARRLCVEGEMPLDLTDYGVPVPNKLGLISMEKVVKVWISLRLRVNPRTEG